jgi:hypothetical protein
MLDNNQLLLISGIASALLYRLKKNSLAQTYYLLRRINSVGTDTELLETSAVLTAVFKPLLTQTKDEYPCVY